MRKESEAMSQRVISEKTGSGQNIRKAGWLKKVYCRTFQFAFRIALPVMPYREPVRYGAVEELRTLFEEKKPRAVLLVTDAMLRKYGVTAPLEKLLKQMNIPCHVYDKTCPNPTVQNVEEAREMYISGVCECIAAIGGGSSIDCAKGVGARIATGRSLKSLKGLLRVFSRLPMIIAMPTTAGTGSEATPTAVLTDAEAKHKYTMNDFVLIPSHAVLDPQMTRTLPPHLTATTGVDALTHAVEAYINQTTTKETRALSLEAVKLVFENVEKAYRDGNDLTARRNMLQASYMAGRAFSKSYVGYIHAVAHSLGGQYNIPHGLANSVIMPYVLDMYGEVIHKKLHELAIAAGIASEADSDADASAAFIQAIRELNRRMGIPEKLRGIREEDIPAMAKHAEKEGNPLYPVPVIMSADELALIYKAVAVEQERA